MRISCEKSVQKLNRLQIHLILNFDQYSINVSYFCLELVHFSVKECKNSFYMYNAETISSHNDLARFITLNFAVCESDSYNKGGPTDMTSIKYSVMDRSIIYKLEISII